MLVWKIKYSMKALCQCAKIVQHSTIILCGLIVFLFKNLNVFNLLTPTKNLKPKQIILLFPEMQLTKIIFTRAAAKDIFHQFN